MKIKNIKFWVALSGATMLATACNEKNLDIKPTAITEVTYYTDEQDYERTAFGIYAKLTDFYWFRNNNFMHGVWLLPGDDVTTTRSDMFEIFTNMNPSDNRLNTINPANNPNFGFYATLYQLVGRSNNLLEKIEAAPAGVYTTANLKDHHRGEALFFRGYANFLLWNYFGTSPLLLNRVKSNLDNINPGNTSGTQLLDQAIKDLTESADLLPAAWPAKFLGRVTKNSANGMLGKAFVFRATVNKNTADYTSAITAFNKITGRSLMPLFDDNFDRAKENNNESLFEYQASQPNASDNAFLSNDFDNNIGSIAAYYGYYERTNNLPGGRIIYRGTAKLLNAFEAGDPRRDLTVKRNAGNADIDYQIQKYWLKDQKTGSGNSSMNNTRILRYADILLLKAEALIQSGGSTTEAIGLINEVRTRARNMITGGLAPANRLLTETDRAIIMDWIRTERFLELAGEEGNRWLDLRRWHLGGQINLATWDFSSANANFNFDVTKHLYFPIPTDEIDYNNNIVQNPNY